MWKKFLNGMAIGAGIAVALITVLALFFTYGLPWYSNTTTTSTSKVVGEVPPVPESNYFLGSTASYSSGFPSDANVLTSGNAAITGNVTSTTNNPKGLRLRLALNNKVWSQWGIVDDTGTYKISVPSGAYVVNGYELDHNSANIALPNNIMHPNHFGISNEFSVEPNGTAHGRDFQFVEPVTKVPSKTQYALGEKVVLTWKNLPNAEYYRIQLHQKDESTSWQSKALFDWDKRPRTDTNELTLDETLVFLTQGKFYFYHVHAFDADDKVLSESVRDHMGYDFSVQ